MKITCQSCQSKYNVADDKVQGKIVKIRCRKCGATIVVNGTGGAATNGAPDAGAAAPAAAGSEAQWHVNVTDTDQRTMTMAELVDAYNAGVVTQETFIWTDGMDDWKPLAEVEPVVSALHASAGQMAVGTPGAFEPAGAAAYDPPAEAAPAYQAAAAPAYEAPAPEPKRAAVQRREARGRDLFATNAGEEGVQTSAPVVSPGMPAAGGGGDNGLTGQRNENSVLFSLAVLTKSADERPAAAENKTTAGKEDSGLIDLKALAMRAESMNSGSAQADVFSAPIGLAPTPLGAPLGALGSIAPEAQPKSKLPLIIGGAGGVVVLLVLGIVLGMKLGGSSAPPAMSTLPVASAAPTTTATVDPNASASAAASVDPSASAAPSASVASAKGGPKGGGGGYHPGAKGGGGSGGASPSPGPGPAPAPAPAPKKGGGDCGCNGDLMCLMKCSTH
jgi:predicted Zn finger-like uncharacterized protein